jgi:methylated-DNA-protein-cysteine methyltransferase-like protein
MHAGRLYAPFTSRVIAVLRAISRGKVATYGQVAALAGNPSGARQVARILHALSGKEALPWHRVIGGGGRISLPRGAGYDQQKKLLAKEGVAVGPKGSVDISRYSWIARFNEFPQMG